MPERVAAVTGANRGLGLATCRALARRGMRVLLTARDPTKAEAAASALRAEGLDVTGTALDVASEADVEAFVALVKKRFGHLDVLVNNAGAIFKTGAVFEG